MEAKTFIQQAEKSILDSLLGMEKGFGKRKWAIARETGIPEDLLTPILKRLKYDGKVEIIMIWSDEGKPDGSGYCLAGNNEY